VDRFKNRSITTEYFTELLSLPHFREIPIQEQNGRRMAPWPAIENLLHDF
jgi:hypothetical protein